MKKLITLLLLFTITLFYSIPTQGALTPPALFDYSFVYDATDGEFQFKDGTNYYTPEFTRTVDGLFFNYEYIGDANGLLPFEVNLRFNRSNTSWTLGTTGYIATDTKIGSDATVGSIASKVFLKFFNNTNNDYYLLMDGSSNTTAVIGIDLKINNNFIITQEGSSYSTAFYLRMFINSNTDFEKAYRATTATRYFDGFYLQDLGISGAYQAGEQSTTAYQNGFTAGFGDGYQQGVQEDNAYALGYARGLLEGSDMETGSSLLILIVALIGFILMIIGFITKRGIFNLLSTGAFIVLGGLLVEFVGFIIIAIGLVLINIYYAFFGNV
jgi:hypothetical protein